MPEGSKSAVTKHVPNKKSGRSFWTARIPISLMAVSSLLFPLRGMPSEASPEHRLVPAGNQRSPL